MQYSILGPLEVTDTGRRIDVGTRRQRQLLAVLLVEADRVVSLDRLIDELWGDTPPNAATASIQAYVSNLRRVLEPGRGPREAPRVLVTEPPGYRLRVTPEQIDARVCEQRVTEAASYAAMGHMSEAATRLRDALAMWRGEPLADFTFDSFASIEIGRLHELRATARERWVEAQLALDDVSAEVFACIEQVVAEHPLRESARALQMVALYRRGRQIEALRVYEDVRNALAEGLGLEPGPELRALQHQVLVQDPALGRPMRGGSNQPGTEIGTGTADAGAGRELDDDAVARGALFVGRVDILSRLHELALAVDDGRPRFALIGGEPGVGKTRLAEELCARVNDATTIVAWGRSHDDDGAPPLWPWVQVLRDLGVRADDLNDLERDTLGALLPELGGDELHHADPNVARFRLFDAVRGVLTRIGADQRCVIVLDDLQWADASAMRLLRFLVTEPFTARVLVVGLFHEPTAAPPGSFGATVVDLSARGNVDRHTLDGLDVADVVDLVEARCNLGDADLVGLATRLHARTNGNAFFLTELIGLLGSEHRLDSAALDAVESDIPTMVADVIRRRVQRLPLDSQAALAVASVVGREFALDVLQVVTGLDDERTFEAMEAALMTRTVVETGHGQYRFAHGLVNDTLYHDLSATRRARLHGRVAEALVAQPGSLATQIAHHFRQAGDRANTARYSERAAEIAERALAFDEAAENLQAALSVDADLWTPQQRVALLVRLSNALRMSGQPVLGCDANDRALDLAALVADPALVALVARSYGEVNLWQVRGYGVVDDRTVSTINRMLEMLPDDDASNRAHLMVALALSLYYRDDERPRGLELIRSACSIARGALDGSNRSLELLAQTLVESLVYLDTEPDATEQLAVLDELVEVYDVLGQRASRSSPFDGTAVLLRGHRVRLSVGDAAGLDQAVVDAGHYAEERNDRVAAAFCVWAQASVAFLRGRYSEAERDATNAFEQHSALGIWGAPETFALHMILIWREQGRLTEIAPLVEPLLEQADYPRAHKMLGLFAGERGDIDRIAGLLGDDPVPYSRDFPWLVEACLTAELAATAALPCRHELYEIVLPFAGRVATMEGTYVCLGSVSHYLGLLADSLGWHDEAAIHTRAGLDMNERIGTVPWATRSRALLARLADMPPAMAVSEK